MYRIIEPEVAGSLGSKTIMNTSVHPPLVEKLNYEFCGWLGDDILETFPCFIMSEKLKNKIEIESLTGIEFDDVIVTKSQEFEQLYPNIELPAFYWAKIKGLFDHDDFLLGEDYRMMISEDAYKVLNLFNINHAFFDS